MPWSWDLTFVVICDTDRLALALIVPLGLCIEPPITTFSRYVSPPMMEISTLLHAMVSVSRTRMYGTAVGHEWRYCGGRSRYALRSERPQALHRHFLVAFTLVPHSSLTCSCGCEAPGIYNAQPGCTSLCTAWFPTKYLLSGACSVALARIGPGCLCTMPSYSWARSVLLSR